MGEDDRHAEEHQTQQRELQGEAAPVNTQNEIDHPLLVNEGGGCCCCFEIRIFSNIKAALNVIFSVCS